MNYAINESKTFTAPVEKINVAVEQAVKGLEGKIIKGSSETGQLTAFFNKTIHGNVVGERTHIEVAIVETSPGEHAVHMTAYPIDPVGRKLQFGARKGVTRTVLNWFLAHLDHQMEKVG